MCVAIYWAVETSTCILHKQCRRREARHSEKMMKSLSSKEMYLYYLFLDSALLPLMEFNTLFQSDESKIVVVSEEIERFLRAILGRFVQPRVV